MITVHTVALLFTLQPIFTGRKGTLQKHQGKNLKSVVGIRNIASSVSEVKRKTLCKHLECHQVQTGQRMKKHGWKGI